MGLSTDVVSRACERVFARVCAVGCAVPTDTPAAAFLSAAARRVDQAQQRLSGEPCADDLHDSVRLLGQASALLDDVARLADEAIDGLDRVCVIVDGLCATIETDQRLSGDPGAPGRSGPAGFGLV